MKVIRSKETPYGDVVLYQVDTGYFVKSGESWVRPICSTVSYPEKKPEVIVDYECAMDTFEKAVGDSEGIYKAVHRL